METLSLWTKGRQNAEILTSQLKDFIGDEVKITGVCVDQPYSSVDLEADLIVATSQSVFNYVPSDLVRNLQDSLLIARRTIDLSNLPQLLNLPSKTKTIVVNDCKETSEELISFIYGLGFEHLWLIPYYPGCPNIPRVNYAITPGERKFVPREIKHVLDLGTRKIDITTLSEILSYFKLLNEKSSLLSVQYISSIVDILQKLAASLSSNKQLNYLLQMILDKITNGVLATDENGKLVIINKAAEKVLEVNSKKIIGVPVNQTLPILKIDETLKTREPEENQTKFIKNKHLLVSNIPLFKNGETFGSVCIFYELSEVEKIEKRLRQNLTKTGFYAKYSFHDILGNSSILKKEIDKAKQFASTDYAVLIIGESGTGKELFASAIHNNSSRKNRPFVAINCAALPIDLLESELFGFEEGTFTGAKKGGKPGLFELAHLGTIFLDEIGEIPAKVQVKLLRVLEEKEVMRIGGESLIPIDVRVIAATNKNLKKLIEEKQFREDLYYRLNVLSLNLPTLRERGEDILLFANRFLERSGKNIKDFLSAEVIRAFLQYTWPGNIRELNNVIEYLMTVVKTDQVEINDLPLDILNSTNQVQVSQEDQYQLSLNSPEDLYLLQLIHQYSKNGKSIGRFKLQKEMQKEGYGLTENQIRTRLLHLERKGYIQINRGRRGTTITAQGFDMIRDHLFTEKKV